MRLRTSALTVAGLALAALVPLPAQAAPPATFTGKILLPANNAGSLIGAGTTEVRAVPQGRLACPGPGPADGIGYKFFDLKHEYTEVRLSGPKPLVAPNLPVFGTNSEYDLDMYGMDAKCNLVEGPSGANGHGPTPFEIYRPKKPVRFILVNYYRGPYPNVEVKVEAVK